MNLPDHWHHVCPELGGGIFVPKDVPCAECNQCSPTPDPDGDKLVGAIRGAPNVEAA